MNLEQMPNINFFWTSLLIEELIRCGCAHFVIAPGSRSTPLVAAVAYNKKARYTISFDERSAAFFALGHAKASNKPAALIVTSGTAVANLMPAVVEASMSRVPLIILSADRPWELRDLQANQTIIQSKFFGDYARWYFELPCPDDTIAPNFVLSCASYAVYRACGPNAGPVHLNCLFREPLTPEKVSYNTNLAALDHWSTSKESFTTYDQPTLRYSETCIAMLLELIRSARRGLVVLGELKTLKARESVRKFIQKLNWPVCADLASGLRYCEEKIIIKHDHHVLLKLSEQERNFDLVIQIGGRLISKNLEQLLQARVGQTHILIDDHTDRSDPNLSITHRVSTNIENFCDNLSKKITTNTMCENNSYIIKQSEQISQIINNIIYHEKAISEPYVARTISQLTSNNAVVFASTSMPIRDYHMFAASRADNGPEVIINRGASGIDGLMSTAIGFAAASQKRMTILIGDLGFLHDANALALLEKLEVPVTIVIINNQGGGIFSFLPVAHYPELLTPFIDTPHDYTLAGYAQVFGVKHIYNYTKQEFEKNYQESQKNNSHIILEVQTKRDENFRLHEYIKNQVMKD
jgi:2-succinyl-5-enolpyruvyl-6-hydroxy-3-cyclohexene-1-carboxylate synthase